VQESGPGESRCSKKLIRERYADLWNVALPAGKKKLIPISQDELDVYANTLEIKQNL
jgi:hypothetical protein